MFWKRFQAVATDDDRQNGGAVGGGIICNMPMQWVVHAYACDTLPLQLRETREKMAVMLCCSTTMCSTMWLLVAYY
jgi:hypothetical protein